MVIDRSDKNRVCIFCFWQLNIVSSRNVIEFPCAFAVYFGGRNTLTPMGATCFAEFEVLLGCARLSAWGGRSNWCNSHSWWSRHNRWNNHSRCWRGGNSCLRLPLRRKDINRRYDPEQGSRPSDNWIQYGTAYRVKRKTNQAAFAIMDRVGYIKTVGILVVLNSVQG